MYVGFESLGAPLMSAALCSMGGSKYFNSVTIATASVTEESTRESVNKSYTASFLLNKASSGIPARIRISCYQCDDWDRPQEKCL